MTLLFVHALIDRAFIHDFSQAVGFGGDTDFSSLVELLCELAAVSMITSRHLPSIVAVSAVVLARTVLIHESKIEISSGNDAICKSSSETDFPPSELLVLSGYTDEQTVPFRVFILYFFLVCCNTMCIYAIFCNMSYKSQ